MFLDTNILLDVLWKRNRASIRLLEQLKLGNIPMYTSYLSVRELIDKEQENIYVYELFERRLSVDEILRRRRGRKNTMDERKEAIDKVYEVLKEYEIYLVVPENEEV